MEAEASDTARMCGTQSHVPAYTPRAFVLGVFFLNDILTCRFRCYSMIMQYDWEQMIQRGVDTLPKQFREKIKNVAILLEDEPSMELRMREGLAEDETLLGFYHGIPLSERGDGYGMGETLPDTITLYKNAILEESGTDPEHVQRVVSETIWHEFGHYFGLDENEVRAREALRYSEE